MGRGGRLARHTGIQAGHLADDLILHDTHYHHYLVLLGSTAMRKEPIAYVQPVQVTTKTHVFKQCKMNVYKLTYLYY
jgi:hypothetical protein